MSLLLSPSSRFFVFACPPILLSSHLNSSFLYSTLLISSSSRLFSFLLLLSSPCSSSSSLMNEASVFQRCCAPCLSLAPTPSWPRRSVSVAVPPRAWSPSARRECCSSTPKHRYFQQPWQWIRTVMVVSGSKVYIWSDPVLGYCSSLCWILLPKKPFGSLFRDFSLSFLSRRYPVFSCWGSDVCWLKWARNQRRPSNRSLFLLCRRERFWFLWLMCGPCAQSAPRNKAKRPLWKSITARAEPKKSPFISNRYDVGLRRH